MTIKFFWIGFSRQLLSERKYTSQERTSMPSEKRSVKKKNGKYNASRKADTRNRKRANAAAGYATQEPVKATKSVFYNDTLKGYLSSISKYKLLTRDEEQDLFRRLHTGEDRHAAEKLVTSNLRLVVKIALDYKRLWMQNLLDLIQEGNIGLIKAVEKFDPDKKVKFSYYTSLWVTPNLSERSSGFGSKPISRNFCFSLFSPKKSFLCAWVVPIFTIRQLSIRCLIMNALIQKAA